MSLASDDTDLIDLTDWSDIDEGNVRAKQNVVFSVLILMFNFMTLFLIVLSPSLRSVPKFNIIASMAVANIVACLTFFPVDTRKALGMDSPEYRSTFPSFQQSVYMYCMPSVIAFSLVCLCVDYMVNRVYSCKQQRKIMTSVFGVAIPWTCALFSLLLLLHTQNTSNEDSRDIILNLQDTFTPENVSFSSTYNNTPSIVTRTDSQGGRVPVEIIVQISLWGFLPPVLAVIIAGSSLLMRSMYKSLPVYMLENGVSAPTVNHEGHAKEISLMDTVTSAVVNLVLSIPLTVDILYSLTCTSDGQCVLLEATSRNAELARWSVVFILPALWMLDAEFRTAFITIWGRLCFGPCVVYY